MIDAKRKPIERYPAFHELTNDCFVFLIADALKITVPKGILREQEEQHGSIGLEPMGGSDAEARELLEKISMPNAGELQFTYDDHRRGIRIQLPANLDNKKKL